MQEVVISIIYFKDFLHNIGSSSKFYTKRFCNQKSRFFGNAFTQLTLTPLTNVFTTSQDWSVRSRGGVPKESHGDLN